MMGILRDLVIWVLRMHREISLRFLTQMTFGRDKLLSSISFFNKNHEYVGVCHSEYWLSDDIKNVKNYGPESNYKFDKLLTRGNCISLSAVILQKNVLKMWVISRRMWI